MELITERSQSTLCGGGEELEKTLKKQGDSRKKHLHLT